MQDSKVEPKAVNCASERTTIQKKRKLSNKVAVKDFSSKERANRTSPNAGAQPKPFTTQPTPGVSFKLKFKPKPPIPQAHKAFDIETLISKATATSSVSDDKEMRKGGKDALLGLEPVKEMREHDELPASPVGKTVKAGQNRSSTTPEAALEGQKQPALDPDSETEGRGRKRHSRSISDAFIALHRRVS